jgi:hypothetical protein
MTRRREPDIDFDLMMSKQGVTRMDEREAQRKGKPAAVLRAAGPEPLAVSPAMDEKQRALLEKALGEIRRLTSAAEAAERRAAEAVERAQQAEARTSAAEVLAQTAAAEARKAVERAQQAEARTAAAERKAAAADVERAAAEALLDDVKREAISTLRLDECLARSGLAHPAPDFAALVAALHAADKLPELLRRITLLPNAELMHFLDDRLAWTCDTCAPTLAGPNRTRVPVPPEQCDVCGGSSIQAAAQRFTQACQRSKITRVVIVGGSPTYHDALRKLEPGLGGVRLNLIRGDAARDKQRAAQDLAGADVAFIWASTVLDHRVGELYRGNKVHTLPVRGLGRMLTEAAKRLTPPR